MAPKFRFGCLSIPSEDVKNCENRLSGHIPENPQNPDCMDIRDLSEGLTFQGSSFNLKSILRLREQNVCQAGAEPAERTGGE